MRYKEIEFKYNAESIKLIDFKQFCETRGITPEHILEPSGYDYFYTSQNNEGFIRHRNGKDLNQLTFKLKLNSKNNFIRTEHNLTLGKDANKDVVQALCEALNFKYNFCIYKNCFIYVYNTHTLVYYIVYNEELKELGRFLEIEASEEYNWKDEKEALEYLGFIEKDLEKLGLNSSKRIKKSLFEMYKK